MAKKVGRINVFQYQINKIGPRRAADIRIPPAKPVKFDDKEQLTGYINGMDASDIEERFARALDRLGISYDFRVPMVAGRWMPGEVEVDFMVFDGGQYQPIQIDGMFAHKASAQKATDSAKDAILNEYLKGTAAPVQRIDGDVLETQEETDRLVKELFR